MQSLKNEIPLRKRMQILDAEMQIDAKKIQKMLFHLSSSKALKINLIWMINLYD